MFPGPLSWDDGAETMTGDVDPELLVERQNLHAELGSRLAGIGPLRDALIAYRGLSPWAHHQCSRSRRWETAKWRCCGRSSATTGTAGEPRCDASRYASFGR